MEVFTSSQYTYACYYMIIVTVKLLLLTDSASEIRKEIGSLLVTNAGVTVSIALLLLVNCGDRYILWLKLLAV